MQQGSEKQGVWLDLRKVRAWCAHLYTGAGLVLAMLTAISILKSNAFAAVVFGGLAMVVDATDGILARRWNVSQYAPSFDGRKLDDIIDYLTYTFLPVLFAYHFNVVEDGWSWVLLVVLLASAYGFCNQAAKTEEGYFTGFPSYWNGVILYLYWLNWPNWLAGCVLLIFSFLVFVPLQYISLNQTRHLRGLTAVLLVVWLAILAALMSDFQSPNLILVYGSLFFPVYYFGASLILNFKNRSS